MHTFLHWNYWGWSLTSPLPLVFVWQPDLKARLLRLSLLWLLSSVPSACHIAVDELFPCYFHSRHFYCGFDWQFSKDDWCWTPSTCSLALVNFLCISCRQTFNQCISLFTVNCYGLYKYLFPFCERSSLLWCYSWQLKSVHFGKVSVYLFCLLWFVLRVRV